MELLQVVCWLLRPSFGLPYQYTRRLFISMVLLKVKYVLPVWYTPVHTDNRTGRKRGSIRHTKELAKVQCLGCRVLLVYCHWHSWPSCLYLANCTAFGILVLPWNNTWIHYVGLPDCHLLTHALPLHLYGAPEGQICVPNLVQFFKDRLEITLNWEGSMITDPQ